MTRKPLDPFRHQHHRGPNLSLSPERRFEQCRTIGEYRMHIDPDGNETCFLKTPEGLPTVGCTVFTQQGETFDICWTWVRGDAHAAMKRLPASSGWHIADIVGEHARWKRPAPATRNFGG
jgi:hypothetical protein